MASNINGKWKFTITENVEGFGISRWTGVILRNGILETELQGPTQEDTLDRCHRHRNKVLEREAAERNALVVTIDNDDITLL